MEAAKRHKANQWSNQDDPTAVRDLRLTLDPKHGNRFRWPEFAPGDQAICGVAMSEGAETPPDGTERQTSRQTPRAPKKPYERPAFRFERVFETMALACGKISTTQSQCRSHLKNS